MSSKDFGRIVFGHEVTGNLVASNAVAYAYSQVHVRKAHGHHVRVVLHFKGKCPAEVRATSLWELSRNARNGSAGHVHFTCRPVTARTAEFDEFKLDRNGDVAFVKKRPKQVRTTRPQGRRGRLCTTAAQA